MFGSVNQSPDEDPKLKLTVRIGFCTAVGHSTVLTLCVLSTACTHFKMDETFYPEYHSGLICLQMYRERERLVQAHQSKHSIGGSTSRERERDVCSFCISSVFFALGTRLHISKFV